MFCFYANACLLFPKLLTFLFSFSKLSNFQPHSKVKPTLVFGFLKILQKYITQTVVFNMLVYHVVLLKIR